MFKVGDLVVPTQYARQQLQFNKNCIFPWRVLEVNFSGMEIVIERRSKIAMRLRREHYSSDWFELYKQDEAKLVSEIHHKLEKTASCLDYIPILHHIPEK